MIGRIGRKGRQYLLVFSREDSQRLMHLNGKQVVIIIDCMVIIRRISVDRHYKPPRLVVSLPSSLRLVWEELGRASFEIQLNAILIQ